METRLALLFRQKPLAGVARPNHVGGPEVSVVLIEMVNFVRAGGRCGQMIVEWDENLGIGENQVKGEKKKVAAQVESLILSMRLADEKLQAERSEIDEYHVAFLITSC